MLTNCDFADHQCIHPSGQPVNMPSTVPRYYRRAAANVLPLLYITQSFNVQNLIKKSF